MNPYRTFLMLGVALIVSASPGLAAGVTSPSHSVGGGFDVSLLTRSADPADRPGGGEANADPDTVTYFSRSDAWYWLGAGAAIAGTMSLDRRFEIRRHRYENRSWRRVARFARNFGEAPELGGAIVASYLAGRVFHARGLSAASLRIGCSLVTSTCVTLALKRVVGRSRPSQAPNDPYQFNPFTNHESLPSGHTTEAFAVASALDAETKARWVPWVVYPIAAAVGWSRVHESSHWGSDVVAGAAVGYWFARKTDLILRDHRVGERGGFLGSLRPGLVPQDGGVGAAFTATF